VVDVVRGQRDPRPTGAPGDRVKGAIVQRADGRTLEVAADLVIGADGLRSRVAARMGVPVPMTARHATATVYGYWTGPSRAETRWCFRPGLGTGSVPTHGGATCVFAAMPPAAFGAGRARGLETLLLEGIRRADPELHEALRAGTLVGSPRAFAGARGFLRPAAGPGWALVGDAGFFRDPLTAHGISDALRDAELLARAVTGAEAGGLDAYGSARDELAREMLDVSDRIAALDASSEETRALHHRLSQAMNRGVEVIRGWDAPSAASRRTA
jgi:2-polyprenyl-6-methoxyphenol hydroxylase-like FAD-dependent oxidoreductase